MGFGSLGISIWAVGMSAQFDSALTLGQISAIKPEAAAYALEWNGNLMTMVAVLYVGAFVFFFMGILVLTFAIIRWRPSPAEILLLKLVDQQLAEETSRRA